jgi:transcriptional regulator with XRE-family HTH domain
MDSILATVGAQVRRLRRRQGLTQDALARAIDMDRTMLARIERGEQNLSVTTLARIAAGLDAGLVELVQFAPRPTLDAPPEPGTKPPSAE